MTTSLALSNTVTSDHNSDMMRISKARCLKHLFEDQVNHQEEKNDEGNRFVIREIPIRRLFKAGQGADNGSGNGDSPQLSKGKSFSSSSGMNELMDYDLPEFVVFIQEDPNQFVKDFGNIDRLVSPQDMNLSEDCELNHNVVYLIHPNLVTMGTISSTMDGMGKCDCRNMMMNGEVMVDSGYKVSIDHTTMKTSQKLQEAFKRDAEFSRSFKNWQMNPYLGTNGGSRVEFPNSAIMYAPFVTSMSKPEMGNSHSTIGSSEEISSSAFGPLFGSTSSCTGPAEQSSFASNHQSNDSISSTHSFAFPILPAEWNGSPVRMLEADKSHSRKPFWHKMLFSCWKCC